MAPATFPIMIGRLISMFDMSTLSYRMKIGGRKNGNRRYKNLSNLYWDLGYGQNGIKIQVISRVLCDRVLASSSAFAVRIDRVGVMGRIPKSFHSTAHLSYCR